VDGSVESAAECEPNRDYPFADRLYPDALAAIEYGRRWGTIVILSDGDVVFPHRKIERSGIFDAVSGNALIYTHKDQEMGRRGAALLC